MIILPIKITKGIPVCMLNMIILPIIISATQEPIGLRASLLSRFKHQRTRRSSHQPLVPSDLGCHCDVMEVTLPSERDLTVSVKVLLNGYLTESVVDSVAMVILIREDFFKSVFQPTDLGPVCVLSGIGTNPVHGRRVHNVPFTVGTQTFLHTVCAAPIKDNYLLGLDFMIATGTILNLSQKTLTVENVVIPISINKHPGLQV